MKRNATVDNIPQLDRFHHMVRRQQDTAQGIQEKLSHADDTGLTGLWDDTNELLGEITRLITNGPIELHSHVGDQVFEDMHQDVAVAVTVSMSTPIEAVGIGWRRERLSTSIDLAVYVLDLLSVDTRPAELPAANEKATGKRVAVLPLNARVLDSRVRHAKARYVANAGATRL